MSRKVQVLYDFQAEAEGELSSAIGDVLIVKNDDSYDGWYLVTNKYGKEGLVPSSYVIDFMDDPAPLPPPPPSMSMPMPPAPPPITSMPSSMGTPYSQPHKQQTRSDDSDDFDDDEPVQPSNRNSMGYGGTLDSLGQRNSTNTLAAGSSTNSIKSKNLFGLDGFLIVGPVKAASESEKIASITLDEQGQPQWVRRSPPYKVMIPTVSSGKKYHGFKEFTTYILQTNVFGHSVSRRYKQFDWLHERLNEAYPNICVPPLPDKVVTGRFAEEFIKKRQVQLEVWLNRMSLHPVISQSEVFVYFLQCKDGENAKWKEFKRKQEKHDYRGAQWLCTINAPALSTGTIASIKERLDKFAKASSTLDTCAKNVMQAADKVATTHSSTYRKEIGFLGKKFDELGHCLCNEALSTSNSAQNHKLSEALISTGLTYMDIANSYNEQARYDIYPLFDHLTFYRGLLQQMPDIVNFNKNAIQIVEEMQLKQDKQYSNMSDVLDRLNTVNYSTLSEINYFNNQKINDFNMLMRGFLTKQIEFYNEITEKLKKAIAKYDVPPNYFND